MRAQIARAGRSVAAGGARLARLRRIAVIGSVAAAAVGAGVLLWSTAMPAGGEPIAAAAFGALPQVAALWPHAAMAATALLSLVVVLMSLMVRNRQGEAATKAVMACLRAEAEATALALRAMSEEAQALDQRSKQAQSQLMAVSGMAEPIRRVAVELAAVRPAAVVAASEAVQQAARAFSAGLAAGDERLRRLEYSAAALQQVASDMDMSTIRIVQVSDSLEARVEVGIAGLAAAAPSAAPLEEAARELAGAAAALARTAAIERPDPLPALEEAAEAIRRGAEDVAERIAAAVPSAAPIEAATRNLSAATAALALETDRLRTDQVAAVAAVTEGFRAEVAEVLRRIEKAASAGAAILTDAKDAIGATIAAANHRMAGVAEAEVEAATAQRAVLQAMADATAALAHVGGQVAADTEEARTQLATGAAMLEAMTQNLTRVMAAPDAGLTAWRHPNTGEATRGPDDAVPGTAAHAALSALPEPPAVLQVMLSRLGGVDGNVSVLADEAEALAMTALEDPSILPGEIRMHTPALLESLETTIGRLRSVATALAVAGDAAAPARGDHQTAGARAAA